MKFARIGAAGAGTARGHRQDANGRTAYELAAPHRDIDGAFLAGGGIDRARGRPGQLGEPARAGSRRRAPHRRARSPAPAR